MQIPSALTAGDSATWADGSFGHGGRAIDSGRYGLTYCLRGPVGAAALDLVGVPSGTGWAFSLTPAQSGPLNVGAATLRWYWTAFAAADGERVTAGSGVLLVRPNLAAPGLAYDGRSKAEQVLDAVEKEIQARATGGATVEYSIGNRSLKKEPLAALLELRSRYRLIVSRERRAQQRANGQGNPQRLGIRFK